VIHEQYLNLIVWPGFFLKMGVVHLPIYLPNLSEVGRFYVGKAGWVSSKELYHFGGSNFGVGSKSGPLLSSAKLNISSHCLNSLNVPENTYWFRKQYWRCKLISSPKKPRDCLTLDFFPQGFRVRKDFPFWPSGPK